ncbi:MAG: hypothetical protein WD802_01075 [Gemmatimonadaceae bacterium]
MIRTKVLRHFAIVLSAAFALACADSPTGPSTPTATSAPSAIAAPSGAQNGLLSGVFGILRSLTKVVLGVLDPNGIPVTPVQWASTHTNVERTVTGTIGRYGGTLAIPGSDFTITFPYGALSVPTAIRITSDASGFVSYDMQPHGLQFAKPVVVTQRLRNTKVYGTPLETKLFGAYFSQENPLLDLVGNLLEAVEIVTSVTILRPDGSPEVQTWLINHFSRYMLASG